LPSSPFFFSSNRHLASFQNGHGHANQARLTATASILGDPRNQDRIGRLVWHEKNAAAPIHRGAENSFFS